MNNLDRAKELRNKGQIFPIPCPDNVIGCAVFHQKLIYHRSIKKQAKQLKEKVENELDKRCFSMCADNEKPCGTISIFEDNGMIGENYHFCKKCWENEEILKILNEILGEKE